MAHAGNDSSSVLHLDGSTFDAALKEHPALVVDFWAPWCGPCRMLAPIFEQIAAKHAGSITFAKVNVDEVPELAARFGVLSIPTCIIFKNGERVGETVGALAGPALEQRILSALGR
mgnify:CR=1 FL=1